jgi:O-antigen/teichoic acid export membrane protein
LISRHYYGSHRLHELLMLMSFALIADAIWLFGSVIARGETWIAADPVYLWLFRFLAIAVMIVGVWVVWRSWLPAMYP